MKKLLVILLVIFVPALLWMLSSTEAGHAVLLSLKGCGNTDEVPAMPARYMEGEEALRQGNRNEALRCIAEGKETARDSDEYYRYEVLAAKYHFTTMQTDSFWQSHLRLKDYLRRLTTRLNERQQLLRVECEMQRGVYETVMVGRMDSALFYNLSALDLAEHLPYYTDNRLVLLTNIADVYKQMGSYDKAVDYFRQAMELGDSVGLSDATRITIDIGIASAYAAMGSFEQSAQWWERARELRSLMQPTELFHYLNNRGNDYYLQGLYRESLQCFVELDSLIGDNPDMVWEHMFVNCNLSDVYIKIGDPERARPLLDKTEQFFRQQNQLIPLYYLATQRIELALIDGQYRQAAILSDENPTPQWMIPEQKVLRQKVLLRLYEKTGQWHQYALAMQSLDHLRDSIADDNVKMRFSEALMHYEHEKQMLEKQQQIEVKELSLRRMVALLVVAGLVIALLIVVTVLNQRERRLKELKMRGRIASLRMETVRNRITPHFISNALTAEMLAQMEGREVNLDSLVQLLHRGIEFTGTEQTTLADELEFIRFYCNIESRSIGPDFRYEQQIAPDVDTTHVFLPSMSVQILVENALKHGLKPKAPLPGCERCVIVRAMRKRTGTQIEVEDNGVGLPEDRHRNEHTGLRVVRQTIQMLNERNHEQIQFSLENYRNEDGETGCRATLYLPDNFEYRLTLPSFS